MRLYSVDANSLQICSSVKSTLANDKNDKNELAWVEDVKISPNNQTVVVFGTHGGLSKVRNSQSCSCEFGNIQCLNSSGLEFGL